MIQFLRVFTLAIVGLASAASSLSPGSAVHQRLSVVSAFHSQELTDTSRLGAYWREDQAIEQSRQQAVAYEAEQTRLQAEAQAQAQAQAAVQATRVSAPPAPQQPPPGLPVATGSVQDIITQAFAPYGPAAVAWGLRVARCESGYNPRAYNPAGPYYGLFQFLMSTFRNTPYGGGDIYDAATNARAAAWKFANGGATAWGCN